MVLYLGAAFGVLKKSTRSSRCPLRKGSSTLRNDIDENEAMYGQRWDNKQILTSGAKPSEAAAKLIAVLNKYSPRETH